MMDWFTPARRRWIYRVSIALGPVLIAYGVLDDRLWLLWVSVLQAVFVPAMALRFVPGGDDE